MTRFEKWSIWTTSGATALTGVAFFWAKYLVRSAEPWAVINHPLQPWFLKAHILVAPLLVFALGMIAARHIWRHFRSGTRWGRRSGLIAAFMLLPMTATGYGIQAATHVGWLEALGYSHTAFGLVYAIALGLHQPVVRRKRRVRRDGPQAVSRPASPQPARRT